MNGNDREAFMSRVASTVLDDTLEDKYGHMARQEPDLENFSPTGVELRYLMRACIMAHNSARQQGEFMEACIHHRNMHDLAAIDSELEQELEQAMQQPEHPLQQLLGSSMQDHSGGPF